MNEFWYGLILFLMLMAFGIYLLHRGQIALKDQLDGRLTQLLSVTKELARSQGIAIGRAEFEAEKKSEEHPEI